MTKEVKIWFENKTIFNIPFDIFGDMGCLSRSGNHGFPYRLTFGACNYFAGKEYIDGCNSGYAGLIVDANELGVKILHIKANIPLLMFVTGSVHNKSADKFETLLEVDEEFRGQPLLLMIDGTKRIFCAIGPNQKLELTFLVEIDYMAQVRESIKRIAPKYKPTTG